jgi:hypothetical protein
MFYTLVAYGSRQLLMLFFMGVALKHVKSDCKGFVLPKKY